MKRPKSDRFTLLDTKISGYFVTLRSPGTPNLNAKQKVNPRMFGINVMNMSFNV